MTKRTKTRPVKVGSVIIGGSHHVVIQSMCNTRTKEVEKTVEQILKLERIGCEIVRVSCINLEDARAIQKIKSQIHIPLVADIHFDYRLALAAIDAGVYKIRINK